MNMGHGIVSNIENGTPLSDEDLLQRIKMLKELEDSALRSTIDIILTSSRGNEFEDNPMPLSNHLGGT